MTAASLIHETLEPLERWAHQCHAASITLVKAEIFDYARVARGSCSGVGGQHSWVVLDEDVYNADATVVDPTLWSYDPDVEGVWIGTNRERHHPQQSGDIWKFGRPPLPVDDPVELTPTFELSLDAKTFLQILGPLDMEGWRKLVHYPMEGWPAGEIIAAIDDTPQLRGWTPIDVLGMLTDRNPKGLYLPGDDPLDEEASA